MSLQPESSRLVFRSALRSRANSYANRRRAKDLAWRWVGTKWPQLIPSAPELESSALERRCPGQRLSLTTNADGSAWVLEVAYSEKNSRRTWTTRATVTDTGEADLMTLQTACSNLDSVPAVIAAGIARNCPDQQTQLPLLRCRPPRVVGSCARGCARGLSHPGVGRRRLTAPGQNSRTRAGGPSHLRDEFQSGCQPERPSHHSATSGGNGRKS